MIPIGYTDQQYSIYMAYLSISMNIDRYFICTGILSIFANIWWYLSTYGIAHVPILPILLISSHICAYSAHICLFCLFCPYLYPFCLMEERGPLKFPHTGEACHLPRHTVAPTTCSRQWALYTHKYIYIYIYMYISNTSTRG